MCQSANLDIFDEHIHFGFKRKKYMLQRRDAVSLTLKLNIQFMYETRDVHKIQTSGQYPWVLTWWQLDKKTREPLVGVDNPQNI